MDLAANILEMLMIVCFGISWPINLSKTIRARTAKGKSVLFNYFVLIGYLCGLTGKFLARDFNLAFYVYFPNIIMVVTDTILYYRNKLLDSRAERVI